MCGEMSVLGTPIAGSSKDVWNLPERRIAAAHSEKRNVVARTGPQAQSDATNYLRKAEETLSAIRQFSSREALRSLHVPFQIGVAAPLIADASLGFSRMGYQSSYTALEQGVEQKGILLCTEGTSSRGSDADNPTQRGDVGFRVRCARVVCIALPIIYAASADNWPNGQGGKLRKRLGSRVPRYSANHSYKNQNCQIPPNMDWAA